MLNDFDLFSPNSILVEELDLPIQVYNSFRRYDINTLQDVINLFKEKELEKIRNIGTLRVGIINNAIESFIKNHYKCYPIILKNNEEIELNTGDENFRKHLENITFDLPLDQVSQYIYFDIFSSLDLNIKNTFGEIGLLTYFYKVFHFSDDQIINILLFALENKIKELIQFGKFSPELQIYYQKLSDVIGFVPANNTEKVLKIIFYKNLIVERPLNDELAHLFNVIGDRKSLIFQKYYLENKSMSSIGKEFGITYTGVKNNLGGLVRQLKGEMSKKPLIFSKTALLVALKLGSKFNKKDWKEELIKLGILVDKKILNDVEPIDLFISIISLDQVKLFFQLRLGDELNFINSTSDK